MNSIPFKQWLDAGVPVVQSTDGRPHTPLFTYWQSLARQDGHTGDVSIGEPAGVRLGSVRNRCPAPATAGAGPDQA